MLQRPHFPSPHFIFISSVAGTMPAATMAETVSLPSSMLS
jgi:hypothetical protein